MVKRITCYQASDGTIRGTIHETEDDAMTHEIRAALKRRLADFIHENLNDLDDPRDSDEGFLCIDDVVECPFTNSDSLRDILES